MNNIGFPILSSIIINIRIGKLYATTEWFTDKTYYLIEWTNTNNYGAKWLLAHADYCAIPYATWEYGWGIQVPSYIIIIGQLLIKQWSFLLINP